MKVYRRDNGQKRKRYSKTYAYETRERSRQELKKKELEEEIKSQEMCMCEESYLPHIHDEINQFTQGELK